jgi:hypothetical protein
VARKNDNHPGYAKLLDAWVPPDTAGEPVGCVTTTFTFSPVFFEEECLGRFLRLQTVPDEHGPLYLIEREEKLAQVRCAAALVDQHHCKGKRSLRWDLLPARVPQGILHAKVSLLCWSRLVRVIVASANLTEDGYRRNQEIFGVLDYCDGSEAPRAVLDEIVDFLVDVSQFAQRGAADPTPAVGRWKDFLAAVRRTRRDWGVDPEAHGRKSVRVRTVLCGPNRPSAIAQLSAVWPGASPPIRAGVLSPFFDAPQVKSRPTTELWGLLRKRGEAKVEFYVNAEDVPGKGSVLLHAPESLRLAHPANRPDAETEFYRVKLEDGRMLHAKAIWLEDDRWIVQMIGSSNFTIAGLGMSQQSNIECNLVYVVDGERDSAAANMICETWPDCRLVRIDKSVQWVPLEDLDEVTATTATILPIAFDSAIFDLVDGESGRVTLTIVGDPPSGWRLSNEDRTGTVLTEQQWRARNAPSVLPLEWKDPHPPAGLWVTWTDSGGAAWWPVNVKSGSSLPPPAELRNLSLDVLIDVLTSARPLHEALGRFLARTSRSEGEQPRAFDLNPHDRVDTSTFMLQQARRVAWALSALRERLERPVATREGLRWRLRGPVGVMALADALEREVPAEMDAKDRDCQRVFLLCELILELTRVKPRSADGCLRSGEVWEGIQSVIAELQQRLPPLGDSSIQHLHAYADAVREAASR